MIKVIIQITGKINMKKKKKTEFSSIFCDTNDTDHTHFIDVQTLA